MNAATQTIQNQKINTRPRLVASETEQKGMIAKIQTAIGKLFGPNRTLDYETWRDLEFRNEREPERQPPIHLNRWI